MKSVKDIKAAIVEKGLKTIENLLREAFNRGYREGKVDGIHDERYRRNEQEISDFQTMMATDTFNEGKENGYEGMWSALRRYAVLDTETKDRLFKGERYFPEILYAFEPAEFIQIIDKHEREVAELQKDLDNIDEELKGPIALGDEVTYNGGRTFVVCTIDTDIMGKTFGGICTGGTKKNSTAWDGWDYCREGCCGLHKTGRHFDHIDELQKLVRKDDQQ